MAHLKDKSKGMTFNTPLTPAEEREFMAWMLKYKPSDLDYVDTGDYDYRGAYKAFRRNERGFRHEDLLQEHWLDTYKKPSHPTFSDQSIYRHYGKPGRWEGEKYVPYEEPSPWNPFAGGTESPVGQAIGSGFATFKEGLSAFENWIRPLQEMKIAPKKEQLPNRTLSPTMNIDEQKKLRQVIKDIDEGK